MITAGDFSGCLATLRSNRFGREKVRPLTPRTPNLLSGMVLALLYCGAVLSEWNNEGRGLSPNSSGKPKIIRRSLVLGFSWVVQQNNDPKHIRQSGKGMAKVRTEVLE